MTSSKTERGITLHDEMLVILLKAKRPMSETEIAREVNKRGFYLRKKDDKLVPPFQIGLRAMRYSKNGRDFFAKNGEQISLSKSMIRPWV